MVQHSAVLGHDAGEQFDLGEYREEMRDLTARYQNQTPAGRAEPLQGAERRRVYPTLSSQCSVVVGGETAGYSRLGSTRSSSRGLRWGFRASSRAQVFHRRMDSSLPDGLCAWACSYHSIASRNQS